MERGDGHRPWRGGGEHFAGRGHGGRPDRPQSGGARPGGTPSGVDVYLENPDDLAAFYARAEAGAR